MTNIFGEELFVKLYSTKEREKSTRLDQYTKYAGSLTRRHLDWQHRTIYKSVTDWPNVCLRVLFWHELWKRKQIIQPETVKHCQQIILLLNFQYFWQALCMRNDTDSVWILSHKTYFVYLSCALITFCMNLIGFASYLTQCDTSYVSFKNVIFSIWW